MSHVATVVCEIKDLDALAQAAANKRTGATLTRNVSDFAYYAGSRHKCQHKISIPGTQYEIGVVQKARGEEVYDLAYDSFDGKLDRAFGSNLEGLTNEYMAVVAENALANARCRIEREDVEGDPQAIRVVGYF